MRVLVDIVHPAHAHFYRRMIEALTAEGAAVRVVSRHKEVTEDLLDAWGIPHRSIGAAGRTSKAGQAAELLDRVRALRRLGRQFRPDVVLTRSPAGAEVARLIGAVGIFDTDDGREVGVHYWAAAPFAHIITTPTSIGEDYGTKHRIYPGYKALAYLHPDRYTPDPDVRRLLGVERDEPYYLVRFVALTASHDHREQGLSTDAKMEIIERLQRRGQVFVSCEGPTPPELEHLRFRLPADRMHDALAFATMCVGDSQTMAAEAALLGTPALRASSFTGRLGYLGSLEHAYGLLRSFQPDEAAAMLATMDEILDDPATPSLWEQRRAEMLAENVDVTSWYLDLIHEVVTRRRGAR